MLTERTEVDRIEFIGEDRVMQIRTVTIIEDDGVIKAKSYHREVVQTGQDARATALGIDAISNAAWTPEIRAKAASRPKPRL